MVLDTKKPQGAHNAARYKESLRDGREVWLDGEKVKDVTTHPAFASTIDEMARIYELQHTDEYRDQMTFVSPDSGVRCSLSTSCHTILKTSRRKDATVGFGTNRLGVNLGEARTCFPSLFLACITTRKR